jgi:hypothetical protein
MDGSGTAESPYLVETLDDLESIGTDPYTLTSYYKLIANIDASPTQDEDYNGGAGWYPIGDTSGAFGGYFDGDNHTISGLYINRPSSTLVGLFGRIDGTALYVKNLKLTDVDITGGQYTGGIVGILYKSRSSNPNNITNCQVSGSVVGTSTHVGGVVGYSQYNNNLTYIIANVEVSGVSYVGGIVGYGGQNYSVLYYYTVLQYCASFGTVTGSTSYAGGLGGYFRAGQIINCFSHCDCSGGSDVAGACGHLRRGYINYSYSKGAVITSGAGGGLVAGTDRATATSSYWDTETSGRTTSILGTGKTTAEMKTQSTFTSWDFDNIWSIGSLNDGYPYIASILESIYIFIEDSIEALFQYGCGT